MSHSPAQAQLGRELIFLISQPRSGSTLLQQILGSHTDVLTVPEPWHMLHLVYALKPHGLSAEYNASLALQALRGYLDRLRRGRDTYLEAQRKFALHLYRAALADSGKSCFLDKTPRYYYIIDELARLFPESKFIFLTRNPLSVFASTLDHSFNGDWWQLISHEDFRKDLMLAPKKIVQGIGKLGERAIAVKYEDLVLNAEATVRRVCDQLSIQFDLQMLNYERDTEIKETDLGDQKSINKHTTVVNNYLCAWQSTLDSSAKTALAKAYLNLLDDDVFKTCGETRNSLLSRLTEHEKVIKDDRKVNDQAVLEALLQPGRPFKSPVERLKYEVGARLKGESMLSKIRWLSGKLMH